MAKGKKMMFASEQENYDNAMARWEEYRSGRLDGAYYLSAANGTGARYAVAVTKLPATAVDAEGGRFLVTVIQPWQASYVFGDLSAPTPQYIMEKLKRPEVDLMRVHGGDAAGLVRTVTVALQRLGLGLLADDLKAGR